MRKILKRSAALLPLALIGVSIYFCAQRRSDELVYAGLKASAWEDEANSLANTRSDSVSYRLGNGLRKLTGQSTRLERYQQLSSGNDAEAIQMLTVLLESSQVNARFLAVSGLRSRVFTHKSALPALRDALVDPDKDVRDMAQQVISDVEFLDGLPDSARRELLVKAGRVSR